MLREEAHVGGTVGSGKARFEGSHFRFQFLNALFAVSHSLLRFLDALVALLLQLGSDFFSLDPGDRILSIVGCSYHETRFTERWA